MGKRKRPKTFEYVSICFVIFFVKWGGGNPERSGERIFEIDPHTQEIRWFEVLLQVGRGI